VTLSAATARHDLSIKPGPSYSKIFRFTTGSPPVPVDLSSYNFSALLMDYEDSLVPVTTFQVDDSQALNGELVLSLTDVQTTVLARPRYWWRLVAVSGSTTLWPIEGFVFTDQVVDSCDIDVFLMDCDVSVSSGGFGVPGPSGNTLAIFSFPGVIAPLTGTARLYMGSGITIQRIIASVSVAPAGASVILDVNRNGTTIFTTQANRPTIPIGGFVDLSSVPDVTTALGGDYLTIDVDQVGSVTAGSDLVVQVEYA